MQKDVLWKAGVLTLIVFIAGIGVGVWLDAERVDATQERLSEIDLQWNDARLQNLFYGTMNDTVSCYAAIDANLEFNEKIYAEGKTIETYENVNRFAPQLLQEKKRYALLQLQFWLNSIALKKQCNADYNTMVYFYSYYDESVEMDQNLQSAVLTELKEKCGNSVLLIPLPADLDMASVDLLKDTYGIEIAPSILIDESVVLHGLQGLEELEEFIKC